MDIGTILVTFTFGALVGFIFAGSKLAQRLGLAGRRDDVKAMALEVLQETNVQTRQMLDDTEKSTKTVLDHTVLRIQSEISTLSNKVNTLENNQMEKMGELSGKIQEVLRLGEGYNKATMQLVNVWGGTKAGGDWGERNLKELVQISGMTEHVTFETQEHHEGMELVSEGERLIPDMTIHCADGSLVFVDSKVVIKAYLDAVEKEAQADERKKYAQTHYKNMKANVDNLIKKGYHTKLPNSLPFTVMYVFSDVCLSFAEEGRGSSESIAKYALRNQIMIVTPTTLFALLNVVYDNWRQMTEYALVDELMKHITRLGTQIDKFIDQLIKHNKAMGELYASYNGMQKVWNDEVVESIEKVNEMREQTIQKVDPLKIPTPVSTFLRNQRKLLKAQERADVE